MQAELYQAFDDCLNKINGGEGVNTCLARYLHLRQQLVPMLYTALALETVPRISAPDSFRKQAKARLFTRIHDDSHDKESPLPATSIISGLSTAWATLRSAFIQPARVAIPITILFILLLEGIFVLAHANPFLESAASLASQATLSRLSGNVELQASGSGNWVQAQNGVTLTAGSRIRTAPDAEAMLTFFNGTTLRIEPGTDLTVASVAGGSEDVPTAIVLQQWVGKTWSRVAKLTDPGARYEIQTPSAIALVRGTVFTTEVAPSGATTVATLEGLVSVQAQGNEVFVAAGTQTTVLPGMAPTQPTPDNAQNNTTGSRTLSPAGAGNDNNGKPPPQDGATQTLTNKARKYIPWDERYDGWLFLAFVGVLSFSFGLTAIMWRRH